jgi:hypothetical protein
LRWTRPTSGGGSPLSSSTVPKSLCEQRARGLYADTPVTNEIGRSFYEALGYWQAYRMPEYYDEGLDGVTYLKLFPK